ncbi:MAG: metal-dependent hydrolase [Burkholderiaceae bacterium]
MTAANEHFTALFAEWLLARPALFKQTEPRLRTLWLWHSAPKARAQKHGVRPVSSAWW